MKSLIQSKIARNVVLLFGIINLFVLGSCKDEDPVKEDTPELITLVTLTFTPADGAGATVVATANDPDGEGVQNIKADGPINLVQNKRYNLAVTLTNGLLSATEPGYDITSEVYEEADEHQLFYSWTNDFTFESPSGWGNIYPGDGSITYNDHDKNNLPIGLATHWLTTTTDKLITGKFRLLLKHQPGQKSSTSNSTVGETDLDVEFTINVQ